MKVFIVQAGNRYEGLQTISAHKTMESATARLEELANNPSFYGGDKDHNQYASCIEIFEVEK